jgi:hypothetical protein
MARPDPVRHDITIHTESESMAPVLFASICELIRSSGTNQDQALCALRAAEAFLPELVSHTIYADTIGRQL